MLKFVKRLICARVGVAGEEADEAGPCVLSEGCCSVGGAMQLKE